MKKVGIITLYYKTYNYGAQLQAYALQRVISNMGYSCEVIRYDWLSNRVKRFYESKGNAEQFSRFSDEIPHSKQVYSEDTLYDCNDQYDIIVCGSDQIWGLSQAIQAYKYPHLTGEFADEDKVRIGYAVSMGTARLLENERLNISPSARKLDRIAVREKSAIPFVSNMVGREVKMVLDPTLLLTRQQWKNAEARIDERKEYILLYRMNSSRLLLDIAYYIANKYGYEVEEIAYTNENPDGPKEWLAKIAHAKYVVTNSFHGTVFSIIYHKQFVTCGVDEYSDCMSRNTRMIDLLELFQLSERYIDLFHDIQHTIAEMPAIDYEKVEAILQKERERSLEFLQNALELEKQEKICSIIPKTKCYGCSACYSVCPVHCITMKQDEMGFYYSQIDYDKCIQCGKCYKVCPSLQSTQLNKKQPEVYSIVNNEQQGKFASKPDSIFYTIAKYILHQGGVVFGAMYNEKWEVQHGQASTIEELELLRGSKSVQSNVLDTYKEAKVYLQQGKIVLYTGTPCQIAGLKNYIGDEPNLYCVDLICAGVGAPKLLEKYITHYEKNHMIKSLNMRSKILGSRRAVEIQFVDRHSVVLHVENDMHACLCDEFKCKRCYDCGYNAHFQSDITMDDFGGAERYWNDEDEYGSSIVLARTDKGENLLNLIREKLSMQCIDSCEALWHSQRRHVRIKHSKEEAYLRNLFAQAPIEQLYYEYKNIKAGIKEEEWSRRVRYEKKISSFLLQMVDNPKENFKTPNLCEINGKIVIYGMDAIGKFIFSRYEKQVVGLIDNYSSTMEYKGYVINRLEDINCRTFLEEAEDVTVIIVPSWDYNNIVSKMKKTWKINCKIVDVERVFAFRDK